MEGGTSSWHGVLIDLYRLHVRGMARRGLLEHIHVSKAAGSTMCQVRTVTLTGDEQIVWNEYNFSPTGTINWGFSKCGLLEITMNR